jgi:hypothetical protein
VTEAPFSRFSGDDEWREALGALDPSAGSEAAPDPAFRALLLARTQSAVRARRRRGALLRGAAAALLFAAGWLLGAHGSPRDDVPASPPVVGSVPVPAGEGERAPALPPNPADLERALARAEPAERRAALRRAGDAYLGGALADPSAALHCYQELLADRPGGESLEISGRDSWLLKALKVARR